ncbi:MAG: hypothetical protein MI747_15440 [Desulfobacterales bacterium]|nr:hypothetical protein [Desulfobacterales bacterium]
MGIKEKKFNQETFQILEHDAVPGYRPVFHIVLCLAVVYFVYIFFHAGSH